MAGIFGLDAERRKAYILEHGCYSAERNRDLYEGWFRNSPRYLFKEADRRYGLTDKKVCDIGCSYGMNPVKGKNWCLKSRFKPSVEAYFSDILKTSVKYEKKSVRGAVFGRSLGKGRVAE